MPMLMLQLLQSIVEMVDECKSAVNTLRQHCQLTKLSCVESQADANQRTGLPQFHSVLSRFIITTLSYNVCLG